MGGHSASLSWQHTLEQVPALDSVVRFQGEDWRETSHLSSCLWHALDYDFVRAKLDLRQIP